MGGQQRVQASQSVRGLVWGYGHSQGVFGLPIRILCKCCSLDTIVF